ncbi:MAG: hypothetical protein ABR540_19095 [Acidimicrobiales bacterium]
MRVNGPGSKRRVAAAAGIVAVVLAGASFAWACTSGVERLQVATGDAPFDAKTTVAPGEIVVVEGKDWNPGTVSMYLALATNPQVRIPLVDRVQIKGGEISAQFMIPANLAPNRYTLMTWHHEDEAHSRVARPVIGVTAPDAVRNNPPAPGNNGAINNDFVDSSPVTGEVPAASTANAPAAVAAGDTAQAPESVTVTPQPTGDPVVAAQTAAPVVSASDWTGTPSGTDRSAPRKLGDTPSESTNGGLLVGAGLLAAGSVALFGGFAVAVARRRKVAALATRGF